MLYASWRRAALGGVIAAALVAAGPAWGHDRLRSDGAVSDTWAALAHEGQHGPADGHLPAINALPSFLSFDGRVKLADGPGRIADVSAKGYYAYLTSFDEPFCARGGVYIVDLRTRKQVGYIPSHTDTFAGEGSQVISLDTPSFKGDLLVYNNETCGDQGVGGVTLVDVSDPLHPKKLVEGFGDFTNKGKSQRHANQIHSSFAWQAGSKAYAILVDDEESLDTDIIDITNPSRPTFVSETDWSVKTMANEFPGQPNGRTPFLHDLVVKNIAGHYVGLLSYWDGGYLKLNLDDPASPQYIADSRFDQVDPEFPAFFPEGNGHQSEFTRDSRFTIGTDEDFNPYRLVGRAGTSVQFSGTQGSDTPPIDPTHPLNGPTTFVGLACDPAAVPPAGSADAVAVIERGVCTFTEKVQAAQAAGYQGAIVFNRTGEGGCEELVNMLAEAGIPAIFVARKDGFRILGQDVSAYTCSADGSGTAAPAVGTKGLDVSIQSLFDGWGYVHLFDASSMAELDTFVVDEAKDPAFAQGFGDLTVHEVATDPERDVAYLSYYNAGLRVLDYSTGQLTQIGRFIDQGGNNFWGVEWHRTPDGQRYVLASDRDFGLYVFKLAAP